MDLRKIWKKAYGKYFFFAFFSHKMDVEDVGETTNNPVDTGRKLNAYKTFRRRPGHLLKVLCTFNLPPVSTVNVESSHLQLLNT